MARKTWDSGRNGDPLEDPLGFARRTRLRSHLCQFPISLSQARASIFTSARRRSTTTNSKKLRQNWQYGNQSSGRPIWKGCAKVHCQPPCDHSLKKFSLDGFFSIRKIRRTRAGSEERGHQVKRKRPGVWTKKMKSKLHQTMVAN